MLARKHAGKVKGHVCAYTQNAPSNEYLGQEIVCA